MHLLLRWTSSRWIWQGRWARLHIIQWECWLIFANVDDFASMIWLVLIRLVRLRLSRHNARLGIFLLFNSDPLYLSMGIIVKFVILH